MLSEITGAVSATVHVEDACILLGPVQLNVRCSSEGQLFKKLRDRYIAAYRPICNQCGVLDDGSQSGRPDYPWAGMM